MVRPRDRPLFVWDGECGFCRHWVRRWRFRVGDAVDFAPYQDVSRLFPEHRVEELRRSARLITVEGGVHRGAAAVFRLLAQRRGRGALWWLYRRVPPFRWLSDRAYRFAADHRRGLGRLTTLLWGPDPPPARYRIASWLFVRTLALVYLLAFLSLLVQVSGLVGPGGILPVGGYLEALQRGAGGWLEAVARAPTLAWLGSGEWALRGLCVGGAGLSLLLFLGWMPSAVAAGLWAVYLSLTVAGQEFMAYQWDALLLEAGFLSVFLTGVVRRDSRKPSEASGGGRSRLFRPPDPPFLLVALFWFLLFRLMLESGGVKLASGDPVWRNLTALAHHFETQPIPNALAWYAHHLPSWAHRAGTLATLVVELGAPFLFFLPRRPRALGGWAVIALQALIAATGNYTFFNLLTVGLAFMLFDDAAWHRALEAVPGGGRLTAKLGDGRRPGDGGRLEDSGCHEGGGRPVDGGRHRDAGGDEDGGGRGAGGRSILPAPLSRLALIPVAGLVLLVGGAHVLRIARPEAVPGGVQELSRWAARFRMVNSYGLFADMTTWRPEIVLEGRRGAGPWMAYDFRYKPDDPSERPPQVAPHQPRLDWQMWFAALTAGRTLRQGRPRYDRWFAGLVRGLLQGRGEVTGLLSGNSPFRRRPPDALRGLLYEYRFAPPREREKTGRWWSRRRVGVYVPPVTLSEGRVVPVGGRPRAPDSGRAGS